MTEKPIFIPLDFESAKLALKQGHKLRAESWYWGRYIFKAGDKYLDEGATPFPKDQFDNTTRWEFYYEHRHGWQHSEEYTKEKLNERRSNQHSVL